MATKAKLAPLIVIVGETASGKTEAAIRLAKELNGEIICADSRTIYKSMDIGTAKPTKVEQEQIKHHLLDLVEPNQRYTAAEFQKAAQNCIADIADRGKLPIMIGGSGLYVDSVIFEYQFRTKTSIDNNDRLDLKSTDELYNIADKKGLQPVTNSNRRYLTKLIQSGQTPPDNRQNLRDNTLVVGLHLGRTVLRKRITMRVETMFKQGLRKEVDELLKTYSWGDPGMTGIGYREFKQYYSGETSTNKIKQKIIYNTLQFAKRQRTWFKRNQQIKWVDSAEGATMLANNFVKHKGA